MIRGDAMEGRTTMNETKTATGWDANGNRDGHEWNDGVFDDDNVNKEDVDGFAEVVFFNEFLRYV